MRVFPLAAIFLASMASCAFAQSNRDSVCKITSTYTGNGKTTTSVSCAADVSQCTGISGYCGSGLNGPTPGIHKTCQVVPKGWCKAG